MLATTNVYSGYLQKLRRFIRRHEMLLGGEPVLVAVSGGVDSMVLLDMLLRLAPTMNLKLGVAHYEHGLRGEASKQDAQFVVETARRHGLKVYVGHGDVKQIAEDHKLSIEEAARRARYTFLRKVARKHRFPVVVTAHSANDNAETVLLNLIRGSGVRGLAAIPPMRQMGEGVILGRPLLDFERPEIERYARELAIEWREDESNESSRFVRNRLRSELLPMLQQYNPSIIGTLNTTAEIMRNLEQYLSQSVQTAIERVIVEKSKERLALNLHHIKHYLPAMQTEIVQRGVSQAFDIPPISFNATERALGLLFRETGQKTDLGAGLTALRDRDTLVVLRELPLPPELEHSFERGEDLDVGRVRLRSAIIPREKVQFTKNGRVEFFDADKLPENLVVRSWKEGDRFRPLGMEGEKKVSDFLVDAKTPRDRKRHVLVLASDDAIVWVCGMRIDERFKVTDETTSVLRIEMQVLPQQSQGTSGRPQQGERPERHGRGGRGEQRRPEQPGRLEKQPREERRGEGLRGDERPREERAADERRGEERRGEERRGEERRGEERRGGERGRDDRRRDERSREDRPREDHPQEDRPRDDRPREGRPREDRPREDRGRGERGDDDRRRDDRRRDEARPMEPAEAAKSAARGEARPPRDDRGPRNGDRRREGDVRDDDRASGREGDAGAGEKREGEKREGDRREGERRDRGGRGRDRRDERRDDRRREGPGGERQTGDESRPGRPEERTASTEPAELDARGMPAMPHEVGIVPVGNEPPIDVSGLPTEAAGETSGNVAAELEPSAEKPAGRGGTARKAPPKAHKTPAKARKAPAKPRKTAAEKREEVARADAERADAERADAERAVAGRAAEEAAAAAATRGTEVPADAGTVPGRVRSPRAPRRAPATRTAPRKKRGPDGAGEDQPPPEE